jgi:hypothetical protein
MEATMSEFTVWLENWLPYFMLPLMGVCAVVAILEWWYERK